MKHITTALVLMLGTALLFSPKTIQAYQKSLMAQWVDLGAFKSLASRLKQKARCSRQRAFFKLNDLN